MELKKIGLLSDTHNYLDPAVYKHFETCDEVWHAGDFGSAALVQQLTSFKPLKGVYGNIDGQDVRSAYPEVLRFACEQVNVLMIHIGGYPGKYSPLANKEIQFQKPTLFISGHSHILKVIFDQKNQLLHINPGAAGKQGWHKVRTLVTFCIQDTRIYDCQVIELGTR